MRSIHISRSKSKLRVNLMEQVKGYCSDSRDEEEEEEGADDIIAITGGGEESSSSSK